MRKRPVQVTMGILGLSKLVADVAPEAIKENEIKNYFGRKVAIDASMSLYQFLIAGISMNCHHRRSCQSEQ